MKSTFDDFEKKIKNLNEDEIGFPINLGDVAQMTAGATPVGQIETVEVKEIPEKPQHPHEEGDCNCPFKKAIEMLDFAKAGIIKLKNTPKPEISPGQPFDENCEYNKIRRSINASSDFVRQIL